MNKAASRVVTIVIAALILFFGALTGLNLYWGMRRAQGPAGGAAPARAAPPPGRAGSTASNPQAARTVAAVRVAEVVPGTIENSVMLNGDVLPASQVSIYPAVGGKLTQLYYRIGNWVDRGQVVAMVDPSRPGEEYSESPVRATVGGTVVSIPFSLGDTVSTSTAVYVIGDLSNLVVETFVPERFSNAAQRGLGAQVSLEALPGESFPAVVDELSPVLDSASRTLRIRLRFAGRDSRIRAGMFATVSLVTNTRRDVPVIPRGAVINTYGSWIVFVVDDRNIARQKVITLGLENETSIEVLSGLELGDRVVSAGQNFLSDGDPVRIVE